MSSYAVAAIVPAPSDPALLDSDPAPLASRSLLIALGEAREHLIAVGDRGHILSSDDRGLTWRQADAVPTQVLLTGVCFTDALHGVAVGHDEIILSTEDGGRHWTRRHYSLEAQRPLLDVWCAAGRRVIAIGAYSAYFVSEDSGASWQQRKFEARPLSARSHSGSRPAEQPNGELAGGYHLNRIVSATSTRLYIAAEAGHLYRSDDAGETWLELPSPYEGSFFGLLPLEDPDAVLAFGLRGKLFRSTNAGLGWQPVDTGTTALLDGAALTPAGPVVVGLSGVVLRSRDGAQSFELLQQPDRQGLAAVVAAGPDAVLTIGESGARRIALPRQPAANTP